MFLCGLELDIADGDASTASLQGNFFYPRTLVAAGEDLMATDKRLRKSL